MIIVLRVISNGQRDFPRFLGNPKKVITSAELSGYSAAFLIKPSRTALLQSAPDPATWVSSAEPETHPQPQQPTFKRSPENRCYRTWSDEPIGPQSAWKRSPGSGENQADTRVTSTTIGPAREFCRESRQLCSLTSQQLSRDKS